MPRPYPPEFRERAVALVRAGKPISHVAAELGLSEGGLHNWVRQDQIDRGERPGGTFPAPQAPTKEVLDGLERKPKIRRNLNDVVNEVPAALHASMRVLPSENFLEGARRNSTRRADASDHELCTI